MSLFSLPSESDIKEDEDLMNLFNDDKQLLVMLASRQLAETGTNKQEAEVNNEANRQRNDQLFGEEETRGPRRQWAPSLKPHCDLPSRAVLIPCAGTTGPNVGMPYRQLLVGSGSP